jgi:hypothetical protein
MGLQSFLDTSRRIDALACAVLVIASLVAKFWLLHPVGPIIFFDELLYMEGARAVAGALSYPSGQYPFLYPMAIAPALLGGWGYHGIFVINVLASSSLIVFAWALARTVGCRPAWPAALLCALLPLHWVFPTQVLSENLFVPMFLAAAWISVRGTTLRLAGAFGFGVLLASLFLTKYLALPALPVLWAFWVASSVSGRRGRLPWIALAGSLAGVVVALASWLLFAAHSDIGLAEAFGSKVSGVKAGDLITPTSVALWAVAYLCVLALISAPFLPRFIEETLGLARGHWRRMLDQPLSRLLVLALLLCGGYWLVCIQHSAGALHNYPVPQRIVARYLMHLTPLLMVLGYALVLKGRSASTPRALSIVLALACIVALWLARSVLYDDLVWDLPDWFAGIPLYSADILAWRDSWMLPAVGALLLLSALMPAGRMLAVIWTLVLACVLAVAGWNVKARAEKPAMTRPLHARALLPVLDSLAKDGNRVTVVTEVKSEPPNVMRQSLAFWGWREPSVLVAGPRMRASPDRQVIYITMDPPPTSAQVLSTYRVGRRNGVIYRLPEASGR